MAMSGSGREIESSASKRAMFVRTEKILYCESPIGTRAQGVAAHTRTALPSHDLPHAVR
jgi:hypothetical protein